MKKIVLLDPLSDDGKNLLTASGIEFEERLGLKGDSLRETLAQFDGAICRSGVKITAESLEGNKRLRAIARAGVGVDNIDTAAATRAGIIVMNTPGGNTASTAEHTFALILALSRNVHPAYQGLVEGRWDRKLLTGSQLAGKTLGIVGMGRIGQSVARYSKAFDMKVIAFDPFFTADQAEELGVSLAENVQEMLPQLDYLTVHTPLTEQTRGLIGKNEVAMLKTGCRLINCARGGIYDIDSLVEGLESGKIGGVALDVFAEEPCTNSPLFGKKNVLCTPHLGASTDEAQSNVAIEAVELLVDFFKTGAIRQAVNFSPLDPETLRVLRGYLDVSYRLGLFCGQILPGAPHSCKMRYKGDVCKKDTSLLASAFAAGLLGKAMDQEVSIVSALSLMKERGIKIIEEKSSETGDFSSMISAEIASDKGVLSVSGTLFGSTMPRLVQMNDSRLESYLDGNLLVFLHQDRPGVIGAVGNVFGRHQVNIAQMSVGRGKSKQGGEAVGILALDSCPPTEAIQELLSVSGVNKAWNVSLPALDKKPSWLG